MILTFNFKFVYLDRLNLFELLGLELFLLLACGFLRYATTRELCLNLDGCDTAEILTSGLLSSSIVPAVLCGPVNLATARENGH